MVQPVGTPKRSIWDCVDKANVLVILICAAHGEENLDDYSEYVLQFCQSTNLSEHCFWEEEIKQADRYF